MNAAWRRVLIASAVIVTLVALGALEFMTARLPVDQSLTAQVNSGNGAAGPWQDYLIDSSITAPGSR